MNSALNSSANSSNHQASAMVPASALGALLDDVFTGESAGSTLNNGYLNHFRYVGVRFNICYFL